MRETATHMARRGQCGETGASGAEPGNSVWRRKTFTRRGRRRAKGGREGRKVRPAQYMDTRFRPRTGAGRRGRHYKYTADGVADLECTGHRTRWVKKVATKGEVVPRRC